MKRTMKLWPFAVALAWAAPAMAADLGTISVTADRSAAPIATSSKPVTVIDRQTIEASHAQNALDLIKGMPNVVVRGATAIDGKQQVDLGGFGETASANNVVLIDGRRVNAPDGSGVDWTQIPVDQIERIEIVHGAASVLYGQGAVGGVINIITRVPESGAKVSAGVGSYRMTEGAVRAGLSSDSVRIEGNASGSNSDGYRRNGQFRRFDGGVRGEIDLPAGHMLYFSANHHEDRAGLPGSLTLAQMAVDRRQTTKPTDYSTTKDDFVNGGLQVNAGQVSGDLPVTYRKRKSDASYGGFIVSEVLKSLSTRPKLELDQDIGSMKSHWVAGADIDRTDGTLGGVKAKRNSAGYYGFVKLADASGVFGLNGGYRYETLKDDFRLGAGKVTTSRKGVYDIGLTAAKGGFHFALDHSTSVRMPLVDEQVIYPFPTFVQTYQAVKMQTGKHYSVSARYGNDQGYAEISFSRADLINEIFFNPATFANENYAAKTRHDVFMVQEQWKLTDSATLEANYSHTVARFRGGAFSGKYIPAVPKDKAGARVNADLGNGFGLMAGLTWVGSSWSISDQANLLTKLPAYLVADATLRYRWKGAEAFVAVQNLSNRKYSTYSTYGTNYYPAPALNARAGVSYTF